MWIQQVRINAFGGRSGVAVEGLQPGVNVIYGDNEAGKTTLMEAVRAVFFGYFDRRSSRNRYEPPHGGERRLRLDLCLGDGVRWQLDRTEGKDGLQIVDLRSGSQVPEARLRDALHHAERSLYESIFAFSLGELTDFDSLESSAVVDRLMGAALGAGAVSPASALKALEQEQSRLFSPRKRKHAVAQARKALEQARGEINALRRNPTDYETIVRQLDQARGRRQELQRTRAELEQHLDRVRRLLDCRDDWDIVAAAELEAEGLAHADAMPQDALAKLDGALSRLRDARGQQEEKERAEALLEHELTRLELSGPMVTLLPQLESFVAEGTALAAQPEQLAGCRNSVEQAERRAKQSRLACGPTWDRDRAQAIGDPRGLQSEARQLYEAVGAARAALELDRERLAAAEEEQSRAQARLDASTRRREELGHLAAVPADASERVSRLNGEVEAAQARQRSEEREAARAEEEARAMEVDEALAARLEAAREAKTRLRAQAQGSDEVDQLRAERRRLEDEARAAVERCAGLSEETIGRLAEDAELVGQIHRWEVSLREAGVQKGAAAGDVERTRDELADEQRAVLQELGRDDEDPAEVPSAERLGAEFEQQRGALEQFAAAVDQLDLARERRAERQREADQAAAAEERQRRASAGEVSPARLAQIDTGEAALEDTGAWSRRLWSAGQQLGQVDDELARQQELVETLQGQVQRLEEELGAALDEAAVDPTAARRLQQWLDAERSLGEARERLVEAEQQAREAAQDIPGGAIPGWLPLVVGGALSAVGAVLIGTGQPLSGAVLAGVGLVLGAALGVFGRRAARRAVAAQRQRAERWERRKQGHQRAVERTRAALEQLGGQLPAGIAARREAVEGALERLEEGQQEARRRQREGQRLELLRSRLEQQRGQRDGVAQHREELKHKLRQEEQGWRLWTEERGIAPDTSPEQAATWLATIRRLQEASREAHAAAQRAARQAEGVAAAEERVRRLLPEADRQAAFDGDALSALRSRWQERVRRLQRALDRHAALERARTRLATAEDRLAQRQQQSEERRRQWLHWIREQGIVGDPDPEQALALVEQIRAAAERLRGSDRAAQALDAAEQRWVRFCVELCAELELEAPEPPTLEAVAGQVDALVDRCRVAADRVSARDRVLQRARAAAERAERERRGAEEHRARRKELLRQWGFDSLQRFNAARGELDELDELIRAIPGQRRELTTERRDRRQRLCASAEQALAVARAELDAFVQRHGLPTDLDQAGLTKLLDAVADYRGAIVKLDAARRDEERALERWQRTVERHRPLLEATGSADGLDGLEHAQVTGRIQTAVDRLGEARRRQEERSRKEDELARAREEAAALAAAATRRQAEVQRLIESVGAMSEDEYRRWAADAERLRQLQRTIAEKSAVILAALNVDDLAQARWTLRDTDWPRLVREREALVEEKATLDAELTEVTETIGRDEEIQRRLEQSEELARHRQAEAIALAELEQAAEAWLLWTTASVLVEQAREVFERERQPEVLRSASAYFELLTDGAYRGISVRLGEQELRARRADGVVVPLLHLSRGTAEPLYLALRLALIDDFAGNGGGAPPVLMDDILVNFDDTRASHAAAAIHKLGQNAQILLLTCHRRTVEHFHHLPQNNTNVLTLNSGGENPG